MANPESIGKAIKDGSAGIGGLQSNHLFFILGLVALVGAFTLGWRSLDVKEQEITVRTQEILAIEGIAKSNNELVAVIEMDTTLETARHNKVVEIMTSLTEVNKELISLIKAFTVILENNNQRNPCEEGL